MTTAGSSMHRRLLELRVRDPQRTTSKQTAQQIIRDKTPDLETRMIEIIVAPAPPGWTVAQAHVAKEEALAVVLDELSAWDAWHLRKRLANPKPSDSLASAFSRLIPERRARLLAFLGDARRREAVALTAKR